jgi:4-alpha-glucanotransferase
MNTPSAPAGNWTWRYHPKALHPDLSTQLAALMEMTDRDGFEEPVSGDDAGKPVEEASKRVEIGAAQ